MLKAYEFKSPHHSGSPPPQKTATMHAGALPRNRARKPRFKQRSTYAGRGSKKEASRRCGHGHA